MSKLFGKVSLVLLIGLLGACGNSSSSTTKVTPGIAKACLPANRTAILNLKIPPAMVIDLTKTYTATILTKRGSIVLHLDPTSAPITTNNFIYLAQHHFYDCLTFHRVEPGWLIQGGDPLGNGSGGPYYKLPNESNTSPWSIGSLGMASSSQGVNGSQFFIVISSDPAVSKSLSNSGVYNHFGIVTSGLKVPQAIVVGDQIQSITIQTS